MYNIKQIKKVKLYLIKFVQFDELILTKPRKYAAIDIKKQLTPTKLDSKSKSIKRPNKHPNKINSDLLR